MFESFIENELHTYGPWAVFLLLMLSGIGIPLGEDIITIPAGALIAGGHFDFWPTLTLTYVGVVAADVLWFVICFRYGNALIRRRWFRRLIHPRRLLQAKHQFEQRGTWLVVMSRFIPSSRTATITSAGLLHMSPWKFIGATAACVCITAPMQLGLGWLIGRGVGTEDSAQLVIRLLGIIVLVVALSIGFNLYMRYRAKKTRPPRARAKWLRGSHA